MLVGFSCNFTGDSVICSADSHLNLGTKPGVYRVFICKYALRLCYQMLKQLLGASFEQRPDVSTFSVQFPLRPSFPKISSCSILGWAS